MKAIASFRDAPAAYIAASVLEAEGIPFEIRDEHLVGASWLYSQAVGGVKLAVAEADAERAALLLAADHSSEVRDAPEDPDALRCPDCASTDVRPSELGRRVAALGLLIHLPLFAWSRRFRCRSCGHRFRPA